MITLHHVIDGNVEYVCIIPYSSQPYITLIFGTHEKHGEHAPLINEFGFSSMVEEDDV